MAGEEVRIGNVMQLYEMGRPAAESRVREVDQERRRFGEKYLHPDIHNGLNRAGPSNFPGATVVVV